MINTNLWNSKKFSTLSPNAKITYFYLYTCERTNPAGFYRGDGELISAELKLPIEVLKNAIEELKLANLIKTYSDSNLIFLIDFHKEQAQSPYFTLGALKFLTWIEDETAISDFLSVYSQQVIQALAKAKRQDREFLFNFVSKYIQIETLPRPSQDPLETVSRPYGNPYETVPSQSPESDNRIQTTETDNRKQNSAPATETAPAAENRSRREGFRLQQPELGAEIRKKAEIPVAKDPLGGDDFKKYLKHLGIFENYDLTEYIKTYGIDRVLFCIDYINKIYNGKRITHPLKLLEKILNSNLIHRRYYRYFRLAWLNDIVFFKAICENCGHIEKDESPYQVGKKITRQCSKCGFLNTIDLTLINFEKINQ